MPRLASLTAVPFVNNQGIVYPHVAQDAEAHVFAVYDEFDFLQFIGFSKDLRNSLRTLLVRVPDQTMKFKHVDLPELDQERMLAIRKEWLAEVAPNVPPGLTAAGKETWAKPIECGSRRAAEQRWRALLDDVRLRGAREEFEYNEELIEQGIVDVAPSVLSDADRAAIEAEFEAQSNRLKDVTIVVDNRPISFKISVTERFVSKTGAMLDVELVTAEEDSTHVVVVSDAELERFDATREGGQHGLPPLGPIPAPPLPEPPGIPQLEPSVSAGLDMSFSSERETAPVAAKVNAPAWLVYQMLRLSPRHQHAVDDVDEAVCRFNVDRAHACRSAGGIGQDDRAVLRGSCQFPSAKCRDCVTALACLFDRRH